MEKKIIETFSLIQKRVEKIDLSDKISLEIEKLVNSKFKVQKKRSIFLKAAMISVAAIIVILIFNPFTKKNNLINENLFEKDKDKMTLQYARISGKEAKRYYFKSDSSNRLIVWIQKKGD